MYIVNLLNRQFELFAPSISLEELLPMPEPVVSYEEIVLTYKCREIIDTVRRKSD